MRWDNAGIPIRFNRNESSYWGDFGCSSNVASLFLSRMLRLEETTTLYEQFPILHDYLTIDLEGGIEK